MFESFFCKLELSFLIYLLKIVHPVLVSNTVYTCNYKISLIHKTSLENGGKYICVCVFKRVCQLWILKVLIIDVQCPSECKILSFFMENERTTKCYLYTRGLFHFI